MKTLNNKKYILKNIAKISKAVINIPFWYFAYWDKNALSKFCNEIKNLFNLFLIQKLIKHTTPFLTKLYNFVWA